MIRILEATQATKIFERRAARVEEAEAVVRPILEAVRKRGDKALVEYAKKFDGLEGSSVQVPQEALRKAAAELDPDFSSAVKTASNNIRGYARLQLPKPFRKALAPGIRLGQILRPLDCVAAYIPSGRYPLPSTLMMTVIPAQIAGVPNILVASPKPNREIYGTAAMLEVHQVFQMGGAHAIAAFAFGTKTVPKADRIVGPGNIYVAAAKKLLAGEVGIDFVAGPTEILIISNEGDPRWLAADMLAQAEHDVEAAAILLTPSRRLGNAVALEIEKQMADLPTAKVARKSIDKNSAIVIVSSLDHAVELSNQFAPEHLSIPEMRLLDAVKHAGSVFVGPNSPEAAGDYAAGPSHVLPTNGAARLRGGLTAADFVKVISVQELNGEALRRLGPTITTLARAEGLEAHARSVEVRLGK
ncbi:MAG TPA: histidinol dehydrogenase [Bryobacteraceae bacterium]|nr:histidinol dehydrogenase [Bryobacteraceae bacterium]